MKKATILAVVVLLAASGSLLAGTVTVDASKDSLLHGAESNKGLHGNNYSSAGGSDQAEPVLMSFDLSGVSLAPGEYVASAKLVLYTSSGGPSSYDFDVECYPLLKSWVEGIGTDGTYGGPGFPWGPTSIGDASYTYQIVSSVVADATFQFVANGGTAWAGVGASGATDCDQSKGMTTADLAGNQVGSYSLAGELPLTAAGCDVVEDWIDGGLTNNGLVLFLTNQRDPSSVLHMGTRESGCANPAQAPGISAPELQIEIVPEPASLLLLAVGGVGLMLRKKRS